MEFSGSCSHLNVNCVWDQPLIILITAVLIRALEMDTHTESVLTSMHEQIHKSGKYQD